VVGWFGGGVGVGGYEFSYREVARLDEPTWLGTEPRLPKEDPNA